MALAQQQFSLIQVWFVNVDHTIQQSQLQLHDLVLILTKSYQFIYIRALLVQSLRLFEM